MSTWLVCDSRMTQVLRVARVRQRVPTRWPRWHPSWRSRPHRAARLPTVTSMTISFYSIQNRISSHSILSSFNSTSFPHFLQICSSSSCLREIFKLVGAGNSYGGIFWIKIVYSVSGLARMYIVVSNIVHQTIAYMYLTKLFNVFSIKENFGIFLWRTFCLIIWYFIHSF